jgi:hypothetical protein
MPSTVKGIQLRQPVRAKPCGHGSRNLSARPPEKAQILCNVKHSVSEDALTIRYHIRAPDCKLARSEPKRYVLS